MIKIHKTASVGRTEITVKQLAQLASQNRSSSGLRLKLLTLAVRGTLYRRPLGK